MIQSILFDKDGTLIDFSNTFGPATTRVLHALAHGNLEMVSTMARAVDFDIESETVDLDSILIAGSLDEIAQALAESSGRACTPDYVANVDDLFVQHSTETLSPFAFTEGALDALTRMGLPMGVATNDSENGAREHLGKLKLMSRFKFIAGYDSGHGAKPDPGMVQAFAEHVEVPVESVAMVGDSIHDLEAARRAGAVAIGVTSGEADAASLIPFADHVLPHIGDLPELISSLNKEAVLA